MLHTLNDLKSVLGANFCSEVVEVASEFIAGPPMVAVYWACGCRAVGTSYAEMRLRACERHGLDEPVLRP